MPSPTIITRSLAVISRIAATLPSGINSARWSMPSPAGNGCCRAPVVAGQHHRRDAKRLEVAPRGRHPLGSSRALLNPTNWPADRDDCLCLHLPCRPPPGARGRPTPRPRRTVESPPRGFTSTTASAPLPGSALAAVAARTALPAASARDRIASARGWLDPASTAAASASTSVSDPEIGTTSVTRNRPWVRVPVLSNATCVVCRRGLDHGASFISSPRRARRKRQRRWKPVPRSSAQGHPIRRSASAR